jgi:hypothetical protein
VRLPPNNQARVYGQYIQDSPPVFGPVFGYVSEYEVMRLLGTNAMAALVTRGCAEMRRLVVSLGGEVRVATACDVRAGAYNAVVIRFVSRQRYSGSLAWATLSAHALVRCHGTGWLASGWGRFVVSQQPNIPSTSNHSHEGKALVG